MIYPTHGFTTAVLSGGPPALGGRRGECREPFVGIPSSREPELSSLQASLPGSYSKFPSSSLSRFLLNLGSLFQTHPDPPTMGENARDNGPRRRVPDQGRRHRGGGGERAAPNHPYVPLQGPISSLNLSWMEPKQDNPLAGGCRLHFRHRPQRRPSCLAACREAQLSAGQPALEPEAQQRCL